MNYKNKIFLFCLLSLFLPSLVSATTLPSIRDKSYAGKYVSQSIADPIAIDAGATREVIVKMKNTGKTIWKTTGANFVSIYTIDPNYRASDFYDKSSWINNNQPAKLKADTKPGEVGEFIIKLKAPNKAGEYIEKFYLAAENKTWIQGTYFFLKIKVSASNKTSVFFSKDLSIGANESIVSKLQSFLRDVGFFNHAITNYFGPITKEALLKYQKARRLSPTGKLDSATRAQINKEIAGATQENESIDSGNSAIEIDTAVDSGEYVANLLALSSKSLVINQGGESVRFIVRYINDGTKEWNKYFWQEAGSIALDNLPIPNISDPSWQSRKIIASGDSIIKPGKPLEFGFNFRAPRWKGKYILRFQLIANDHTTSGGTLELPVQVLTDAPPYYQETTWQTTRSLISEPNIRVGLYKTDEAVKFQSDFRYEVFAGGVSKGWLEAGELATLSYQQGVYSFVGGNLDFTSSGFLRLVPDDKEAYFTLVNYDRKISWKGAKNFNTYRYILEYVYSPKNGMPYVINELPLDLYIAGIGETSNGAAMEYIKALLVAARSYAYTKILAGVNSPQPSFDVFPTTADQLYLGYNSEVLMPRVVQAAQATYGEMVTYNDNVVITPYFGNSNGWTRSWKEVWGGADKPWLQPVECIYDKGKSMFGHGVGMSAYDASRRAAEDDWTYDQILKYYYTGVKVEKIY